MDAPHLLLVSRSFPGDDGVGHIILRDICRYYPRDRLSAFIVGTRDGPLPRRPGFEWLPMRRGTTPEFEERRWPGRLGTIESVVRYRTQFLPNVRRLVGEVAAFGEEREADAVWMIFDSSQTIAMADDIARILGVPLFSMSWDSPEYLIRSRTSLDRSSLRHLMSRLGRALERSRRVAVISDGMATEYRNRFGAGCTIVRHGLDSTHRLPPATASSREGAFTIGYAGSLYAGSAWRAFQEALDRTDWRLENRPVQVRMVGPKFQLSSRRPIHVDYLGLHSTKEAVRVLGDCDICYLPHPFEESLDDVARMSFPNKLSTYVASGRPVFLHAPSYASVTRFFEKKPAGVICTSLDPSDVARSLERLLADRELYCRSAEWAGRVAREDLCLERFHEQFAEFVGVDPAVMNSDDDETTHSPEEPTFDG